MRDLPLNTLPTEALEGSQKNNPIRERATLEVLLSIGVAFFIVIVISCALRATELFLETKLIYAAEAATPPIGAYQAKLLVRSASSVTLAPDETMVYSLGFKNLGTESWKPMGPHFVSLYTFDPKYRKSVFYDSSWYKPTEPAILKDINVPPGTVGYVDFILHAPRAIGTYTETFALAVESSAWIDGGAFSIQITVKDPHTTPALISPPASGAPNIPPPPQVSSTSADGYGALLLLRSDKSGISLGANQATDITLGFKNTGTKVWQTRSLRPSGIVLAATGNSFRHLSWLSPDEVLRASDPVKPGEIAFVRFTLQAPNLRGSYNPQFSLTADSVAVPGGEVTIPITVTDDGSLPDTPAPAPVEMIPEPKLRVGIMNTERPVSISATGDYTLFDGTTMIEMVPGGQPMKAIFDFDYKTFSVTTPSGTRILHNFVRLEPSVPNEIFTVTSYVNPPPWNTSLNDNQFRGAIEVRQAPESGRLWVIEELPIEQYLYGLAETSNNTNPEFQKALATAARTYAFYHLTKNTKHGGVFHVDAFFDQVYRGYASELRMPQFVLSVNATRGDIATYGGDIAITPYYSRSDGRTRSWTEVWGGSAKPWLVSVPTPYDAGKTLWGHGVGMSARDAMLRADAGADWQTMVKYYYTGVTIVQKWQ